MDSYYYKRTLGAARHVSFGRPHFSTPLSRFELKLFVHPQRHLQRIMEPGLHRFRLNVQFTRNYQYLIGSETVKILYFMKRAKKQKA